MTGPDQKAMIAPNAVHHHGSMNKARNPVIMLGDQKIASAITKQIMNDLPFCFISLFNQVNSFVNSCFGFIL